MTKNIEFSDDFLFGTATASLQIEGGDENNNWYRWCELKRIKDNSHCRIANDHWNRTEEDTALLSDLGCNAHRLSLEWSRIEPEKGRFDHDAITHYIDEIQDLKSHGIDPMVTLYHFSLPLWFEDQGGWKNPESIKLFERYTDYVVRNLGGIVSKWITINEPNVYLVATYISGDFPPGRVFDKKSYKTAARHLIYAHIISYKKIHEISNNLQKNNTLVSAAFHVRVFQPENDKFLSKVSASMYDKWFHLVFMDGMIRGDLSLLGIKKNPYGKGQYADFIGLNYYSRDIVKVDFNPFTFYGKLTLKKDCRVNDLGWEIYPKGIYEVCMRFWNEYKLPVFITENGICDENDEKRKSFIADHLFYLNKAIKDGVDVRGYYHWTLMDNFEWHEGDSVKFGLYHVDYDTQVRTLRKSGEFYRGICKEHSFEYSSSEDEK